MEVWMLFAAVIAGFVACWFLKDKILVLVHGASAFAQKLRAKATALENAIRS